MHLRQCVLVCVVGGGVTNGLTSWPQRTFISLSKVN